MSKSFFEFKRFKVHHNRCAMKVGTDGVLLGAWTALYDDTKQALDVGTGSGLIALMLAQRSDDVLQTDAIDIDCGAVLQTLYNIQESPYSNIQVYHQSLEELATQVQVKKYDLIVSNPPYFVESLTCPDKSRTLARHTKSLSIQDLLMYSTLLMTDTGCLSIIYPYDHRLTILKLAEQNNLYLKRITNVYPTPASAPKRILLEMAKTSCTTEENDLILELSRHVYSPDFSDLVKDFYLKL